MNNALRLRRTATETHTKLPQPIPKPGRTNMSQTLPLLPSQCYMNFTLLSRSLSEVRGNMRLERWPERPSTLPQRKSILH